MVVSIENNNNNESCHPCIRFNLHVIFIRLYLCMVKVSF